MQLSQPQTLYHKEKIWKVSATSTDPQPGINKPAKLVIIYASPSAELPSSAKDMLEKLVQACKFKPEDTVKRHTKEKTISMSEIKRLYDPEVILIFGEINISRNANRLQKISEYQLDGIKVLRTEPLEKLEQMKGEKAALWVALQQMLGLK